MFYRKRILLIYEQNKSNNESSRYFLVSFIIDMCFIVNEWRKKKKRQPLFSNDNNSISNWHAFSSNVTQVIHERVSLSSD